jgi:hypothetical protein
MTSPLTFVLKERPSALEFTVKSEAAYITKPATLEIFAVKSAGSSDILSKRIMVEYEPAGDSKYKLKETLVVLDEIFGLAIGSKYVIKFALYDDRRSLLAESQKTLATLAQLPEKPTIIGVRNIELGKVEMQVTLGQWKGADIIGAKVLLFKDKLDDADDDISMLDIPISSIPPKHVAGTPFSFRLPDNAVQGDSTDYLVKIAFESSIGLGEFSNVFEFKARDVPDSPLGVTLEHLHLDNTLSVKWKAGADSVQYGNLLRFRVDLSVMPFEGRSDEITFASIAQKVPLLTEEISEVPRVSLEKLNEHEFVFDRAAQTEFLSQMSVQFPQYTVSRQLKFKAKVSASDGINSSDAAVSSQVTVIFLVFYTVNQTEIFDLTAKGLQTKKESGIERKINFEAKLKNGITFAQLKRLLIDPKPVGSVSTPVHWAKGLAFQLDLIQGTSKKTFSNSIIIDDATPDVSITPMETDIPFSTSDELKLTFWLFDSIGDKSFSLVYPVPIPLEVPALVYRSDTSFTVNAGIVSTVVNVLSGTKTEALSAKFLLRNFSDVSPNPAQFIETLPLLLEATESSPLLLEATEYSQLLEATGNQFKISYNPQLLAGASQVSEIKLSVFEKQAGVTTPLQIYSEQSGSRVVISNTNLSDVADSVQINLFDRTVSPSSPSEYVALLSVDKSVILQKLKVYNNVEITGRDITIKFSAADMMLTTADESLPENKIDITVTGLNLIGLRIPLASDARFALDLALLNKSSLKETHLFVYLDIQDLRPSSFSPINIITAKINRFIDGQPYKAERVISTEFRDDIGFFSDVSLGRTYDCDGIEFAFRVNRNYNFRDTLYITSWPIAFDGKSIDTPQPVFNYVASNQFILRNNRSEFWALINLKAGGGPLAYPNGAVMVILNTANRSTSNTFKVFLKNESIDGSIIRELNAILSQPLFTGDPGAPRKLVRSIGYSTDVQIAFDKATTNAAVAKTTRQALEIRVTEAKLETTDALTERTEAIKSVDVAELELPRAKELQTLADAVYIDFQETILQLEKDLQLAEITRIEAIKGLIEFDVKYAEVKMEYTKAEEAYLRAKEIGLPSSDIKQLKDKLEEVTDQLEDAEQLLNGRQKAVNDSEQALVVLEESYMVAKDALIKAKDESIRLGQDYEAIENELLILRDFAKKADDNWVVAETKYGAAVSELEKAITGEAQAVKELEAFDQRVVILREKL